MGTCLTYDSLFRSKPYVWLLEVELVVDDLVAPLKPDLAFAPTHEIA